MAYAGIQMFMEKLKQLINCNHLPIINNHPEIISQRPQFQLLYDELGSMIQTLFIDQHQDLHDIEKLTDLKRRFIYAAEEVEYVVDLFLSGVHKKKKKNRSPDDFRRSFKSIEVDFMTMRIDSMEMDSARRLERIVNQSAPAQNPNTENSSGKKKLVDEIFVGLDCDVELIRDKLVEDQKKLQVVSIVGMGGIGKTTLATKVFKDGYVKHHFHVRVWITVSQTYDKRAVLLQILESIRCQLNIEKASDARLRELVHKNLIGKRYLIVIDDIWHTETWDSLKLFFPQDNNGSRILLTSRLTEVAKHANTNGLIHHLGYLNNEESWELLCQKVFHGNKCPEWSTEPGMKIIENCKGLPLAVVVIAGVLAKEAWSEKFWVEIAESTDSYIVDEENGCLETLGLSYNQLPRHLRECFLYFGGFPEDDEFDARWLIFLWVAEGFVQQDGNRSVEDIAEGYLLDLIDRNLIIVVHRSNSNGRVKTCKVHDLIRELCEKKAKEEQFNLILAEYKHTDNSSLLTLSSHVGAPPVRMLTSDSDISFTYTRNLRSLVLFGNSCYDYGYPKKSYFHSFRLLRVLDLQQCEMNKIPRYMKLLVHLRYLAILKRSAGFPSSICNLWNLQTLIYKTTKNVGIV